MSRGDASALLQQALEGHYTGWQARQQEKMERFIEESLQRGLSNLHDPMMWGQNSVKFLCSDDMPPKWMSEADAIDMLYQIAEAVLERHEVSRYHLDHGHRDFAGGKSFTFFRLCNDAEASLQNWITEQTIKTIEYVADAVNAMVKGASQGDADVWAKVPSGKYPNYLVKDEPIPVGLTREQAVQEVYKVVLEVLDKEFDLPGVRVETMGSIMSGTWFKLTYHIPRPQPSHMTPARSRGGEPMSATRTPPSTGRYPGGGGYPSSTGRKALGTPGSRR